MKVIVIASDKYINLMNGYSRLFNRHWSENKEVDILCYKKPEFNLPKNFNVISLGNQDDYGNSWTAGIRNYFHNLEDDYFMLCLEDHFMFTDMNFDVLDRAEKEIQKEEVKKIVCTYGPYKVGDDYSEDFYKWNGKQDCGVPTSLCVSIWTKELFLRLIKNDITIRQFEEQSKSFGLEETILFPRNGWLYPQLDACRAGSFNDAVFDDNYAGGSGQFVVSDDLEIFEQARRDLYDPSDISTSQYYGQWETDSIIEKYFDSDYIGTCVEVGAADGTKGSNTKYFEELEWNTLCIEANPEYEEDLKNRNRVVMSACGKEEKENVEFNVFVIGKNKIRSSLSGLEVDEKLLESHSHLIHDNYKIKVPVRRLDSILEEVEFTKDIDFISIDTEGTELDVLKGIDLDVWNVKLLVVENNHNDSIIENYLHDYGYIKDRRYKVNDFYMRVLL